MASDGRVAREVGVGVRALVVYVCWGGYVEERVGMMVSYQGGRKDCVWVKEDMTAVEVMMLVEAAMGEGLKGRVMWLSLKYDRRQLIRLGRDADVMKLMKGNEEYSWRDWSVGLMEGELGLATRNEDFDIPDEDSSDGSSASKDEEGVDEALGP
ncbi:hypothetical protein Cgig2_000824 [Carnegiea gigantea]|uniref:Uncharacterized protein n=1 Tax=Carnegiea gigantea TaxID=171969 RepID=A0A9Q1KJ60_9CARY|nr:hypothetical protein Cgig2_000824 [Carnegiea gigantea]